MEDQKILYPTESSQLLIKFSIDDKLKKLIKDINEETNLNELITTYLLTERNLQNNEKYNRLILNKITNSLNDQGFYIVRNILDFDRYEYFQGYFFNNEKLFLDIPYSYKTSLDTLFTEIYNIFKTEDKSYE